MAPSQRNQARWYNRALPAERWEKTAEWPSPVSYFRSTFESEAGDRHDGLAGGLVASKADGAQM